MVPTSASRHECERPVASVGSGGNGAGGCGGTVVVVVAGVVLVGGIVVVVGGDVVEVAPEYDSTTNTAHVGAQVLFEILSLMVFSPHVTEKSGERRDTT